MSDDDVRKITVETRMSSAVGEKGLCLCVSSFLIHN